MFSVLGSYDARVRQIEHRTRGAAAPQLAGEIAPVAADGVAMTMNSAIHLVAGSPCADAGQDPGMTVGGVSLVPTMEYVHPAMVEGRVSVGVIDIGAYELGGGMPLVDGGATMDLALPPGGDAGDVTGVGSHGCDCDVGSRPPAAPATFGLALLLLLFRALKK
jgi:hypothetical protein